MNHVAALYVVIKVVVIVKFNVNVVNAYRHAIIDYADVVDDEDILVVAVEMTDGYINLLVGVGA